MDAEICIECENPVERTGEEALYIDGEGPFCEKCFDWRVLEEEHAAVVKELKTEIELLKEEAKLLPEITQKAERYTELCNIVELSKGKNAKKELEKVWQKWERLREGTYIPVEQALCEKAELEAEIAQLKENYAALKDEFNRGAALAQQHCPKPPLGHSVFEGIPLLAERAEKAEAEIEQLKADIPAYATRAAQERVAIVRFLNEKVNDQGYLEIIRVVLKQLIKKIADGEHHAKE